MSTIGERLREERARLGLNQDEFATAGGVQRRAQGSYEAGERAPDATYLAGVAGLGVDVLYIVTGRRQSAVSKQPQSQRDGTLKPPIDAAVSVQIPKPKGIDYQFMTRVFDMVDRLAAKAGKKLDNADRVEMAVGIYNYLAKDSAEASDRTEADGSAQEPDTTFDHIWRLVSNG